MPDISHSAGVRLNKFIADTGICSRREADGFIENGRVAVDGKPAVQGMRVTAGQSVTLNGKPISGREKPVYIAMNKPPGITVTADARDRDNIIDFIGHERRIFPIGRLDKYSSGLILLTNDGMIVNKILRAQYDHEKEYLVTVDRPVTDDFICKMSAGVPILDTVTKECSVARESRFRFRIILTQGLNRQIRRMCEYFGYRVTALARIRIMNITLGNLKPGQWRNLTKAELNGLKKELE